MVKRVLLGALFVVEELTGDLVFKVFNWWWDRTDSGEPLWTWEDEESL